MQKIKFYKKLLYKHVFLKTYYNNFFINCLCIQCIIHGNQWYCKRHIIYDVCIGIPPNKKYLELNSKYFHIITNNYMNEYLYYVILCRYIDRRDRVICSRRDRHLIVHRIPRRLVLMASIYIHMGQPCCRYCICRYFDDEVISDAYERSATLAPWCGYYPMWLKWELYWFFFNTV